ncbi:MAG: cation:proton antiporter [Lautropia sp.]
MITDPIVAIFAYGAVLLVAALISGLAERTAFSIPVLFLAAGMLLGEVGTGSIGVRQGDEALERLVDLALFAVLFADGMRLDLQALRAAWRLPGRALAFGLPITLLLTAWLAHAIVGLAWPEALLVATVLSPTDPVFAAAIVGRDEIAQRLRRLLNIESGLNDGLALPLVLALLGWIGVDEPRWKILLLEVAAGVVVGVVVSWACIRLRAWLGARTTTLYGPLFVVAIGTMVYALARATDANEYLAAFSAGITVATTCRDIVGPFRELGEQLAELLKLAAVFVFGALVAPEVFVAFGWEGWLFAACALLVARPASIALVLIGSGFSARQKAAAGWLGPKGFASVIYAILVLHAGLPDGDRLVRLISLVIVVSIVAHSSTDVATARWLARHQPR